MPVNEVYLKSREILLQLRNLKGSYDIEGLHHEADNLLCEFLETLGWKELVDAYREVEKWYT